MKKALIVLGGQIENHAAHRKTADSFFGTDPHYVIAADSGARAAREMGLKINTAIGDFDSFSGDLPQDAKVIKHPPEKDYTDSELALRWAMEKGFSELLIFGALGGRRDHELFNISLLAAAHAAGGSAVIWDEKNQIRLIAGSIKIKREEGAYISLLPVGNEAEGVSISGVKYPLCNATLKYGSSLSVSNEFAEEEAVITVKKGLLFVIISKD